MMFLHEKNNNIGIYGVLFLGEYQENIKIERSIKRCYFQVGTKTPKTEELTVQVNNLMINI